MKVGDLVEVMRSNRFMPALIVTLDEPTISRPFQIATVQFADGQREDHVTTVLRLLHAPATDKK